MGLFKQNLFISRFDLCGSDLVCLWGNSTDLSLLIDMTEADIKKLQSTGGDALSATEKNILGNDIHDLADYVMTIKHGRIDFVLDNAGAYEDPLAGDDKTDPTQVSSCTAISCTPTGSFNPVHATRSSSMARRFPGS